MEPIKISMRGLAEVTCAKSSSKRTKLKQYKFRQSDESVGRSNYYVRALGAIKGHHKGESDVVNSVLRSLLAEASIEKDRRRKAKLLNNHRAIVDYLKVFGDRRLVIRPGRALYYPHKNVLVSARPDMVAEENGSLVLIKLNLGKEDFGGGVPAMILHLLYESARLQNLPIETSRVECLQASSGTRTVGPKRGFPPMESLNTACEELSDLWPSA